MSQITLKIKVTPKSGKHEIAGTLADGTIKVRLKAAPEQGKANEELIELLSEKYQVPRSHVTIISGHTSPTKFVSITLT